MHKDFGARVDQVRDGEFEVEKPVEGHPRGRVPCVPQQRASAPGANETFTISKVIAIVKLGRSFSVCSVISYQSCSNRQIWALFHCLRGHQM